jgi:hypothetical protein
MVTYDKRIERSLVRLVVHVFSNRTVLGQGQRRVGADVDRRRTLI